MSGGRGGGEPPVVEPVIEFLYWDGCPSHERALELLHAKLNELGRDDQVDVRHVDSDEAAQRERFIGSPTIRVDGHDLFPIGDEPFGLNCRVYRLADGRASPLPDPELLSRALAKAASK